MSEEQTSVAEEVKEESQTASETTGAQEESLDDLLKEFESVEETTEQTETESEDRVAKLERELAELRESQQRQQVAGEIASIGAEIRGDLPAEVFDDETMQAWLDARAAKDPRIQKAFINRSNAPTAWKNVVGALARDFQKRAAALPDKQVTEDVDAVAAAVRSASTRTTEESSDISYNDIRNLSDDEAEKRIREEAKKLGF